MSVQDFTCKYDGRVLRLELFVNTDENETEVLARADKWLVIRPSDVAFIQAGVLIIEYALVQHARGDEALQIDLDPTNCYKRGFERGSSLFRYFVDLRKQIVSDLLDHKQVRTISWMFDPNEQKEPDEVKYQEALGWKRTVAQ